MGLLTFFELTFRPALELVLRVRRFVEPLGLRALGGREPDGHLAIAARAGRGPHTPPALAVALVHG